MGCQFSTELSEQKKYEDQSVAYNSSVDNSCCNSQQMQNEVNNSVQALMIITHKSLKNYLLTYNFREKKWYPRQRLTNINQSWKNHFNSESSILNGKLYFTKRDFEKYTFLSFNPINKQSKTLNSSSMILKEHAMCSCSRFIYFCGGGSGSNTVLMFDPQKNSFATLPPMNQRRYAAAAIFHQGCLYVLGGCNYSHYFSTVEKYDPDTNEWTILASMLHYRYNHAVATLDGKIYACGGFGMNSVEVYDPSTNSWQLLDSMNQNRCEFNVFAHEGKLFAVGGDGNQETIEVYDPSRNLWQIDHQLSSGIQHELIDTSFVI